MTLWKRRHGATDGARRPLHLAARSAVQWREEYEEGRWFESQVRIRTGTSQLKTLPNLEDMSGGDVNVMAVAYLRWVHRVTLYQFYTAILHIDV